MKRKVMVEASLVEAGSRGGRCNSLILYHSVITSVSNWHIDNQKEEVCQYFMAPSDGSVTLVRLQNSIPDSQLRHVDSAQSMRLHMEARNLS